jgi:hypothetical protein
VRGKAWDWPRSLFARQQGTGALNTSCNDELAVLLLILKKIKNRTRAVDNRSPQSSRSR